jgi:hypothetical protein
MTLEHKSLLICWLVGAVFIVSMGYSLMDSASSALAPIKDYHKQLDMVNSNR